MTVCAYVCTVSTQTFYTECVYIYIQMLIYNIMTKLSGLITKRNYELVYIVCPSYVLIFKLIKTFKHN